MATVTGLTADRMLAIEAASVVDGDVVGDNLILTQHGGTQINAGSVRGPQGNPGPVGQDLSVISALPVLAVGQVGQIRAGRQLTAADFTNMGLSAPLGLWNLSDLTDVSGNGRHLLNKGAVPTTVGINGLPNTAARFVGNPAQGLYIPDTGAADPFRMRTGSYGCWFKTRRQLVEQIIMSRNLNAGNQRSWYMEMPGNTNCLVALASNDGTTGQTVTSQTEVCDDQWHFAVITYDGTMLSMYIDGVLETVATYHGIYHPSSGPLNIGAVNADAATNTGAPYSGQIDEAFVTADTLTEEQVRILYCARLPHTLAAIPKRVSLNVQRRRRGAALTVADFPTPPLRLHNFSGGSMGDEGTNGVPLTNPYGAISTGGADGTPNNGINFNSAVYLESTDAGLVAGVTPRSYGIWFKSVSLAQYQTLIGWGAGLIRMAGATGYLEAWCGAAGTTAKKVCNDGRWHFAVEVDDPSATDGAQQKLYVDGVLIASSQTVSTTAVLAGKFYIGADAAGGYRLIGQADAGFVIATALTGDDIRKLYNKGTQTLGISTKNPGDHIETMDPTNILATFDALEPHHLVDLTVAA